MKKLIFLTLWLCGLALAESVDSTDSMESTESRSAKRTDSAMPQDLRYAPYLDENDKIAVFVKQ